MDSELSAAHLSRADWVCRAGSGGGRGRGGGANRRPDPDCVAAAVDRAACAVLGVAGADAGDRPVERGRSRSASISGSRPGDRVPARRHRRVAPAPGRLGAWNPSWEVPACGPVEYLDRLGMVNRDLIAVHGVQFTDADLSRLAAAGATLVTCPRSNRWTGAGTPPVDRFYASGVRVAVGTDSLASVDDLNLFAELAEIRRLRPGRARGADPRKRHAGGSRGPGLRVRAGLDRARQAGAAPRRAGSGRRDRRGRIPGGWHRARAIVRWLD